VHNIIDDIFPGVRCGLLTFLFVGIIAIVLFMLFAGASWSDPSLLRVLFL
jgi:hypothetical protein